MSQMRGVIIMNKVEEFFLCLSILMIFLTLIRIGIYYVFKIDSESIKYEDDYGNWR